MSVTTSDRKEQFVLNQTDTQFDFSFRALPEAPTDIKAVATTGSTETLLTYATHYTVTISTDGIGGILHLVSAAAISKGTLTIYRETTDTQESDYDPYNQFPAATFENDLDKRTMLSQESTETETRSLRLPISVSGVDAELPIPVANQLIGWDAAGTGMSNYAVAASSLPAISAGDAGKILAVKSDESGYELTRNLPHLTLTYATITSLTCTTLVCTNATISGTLTASGFVSYSDTRFVVDGYVRDLSTAAGTVSVTGIGFSPKAVIFWTAQGSGIYAIWSVGGDDGTNRKCIFGDTARSGYVTPDTSYAVSSMAGPVGPAYQVATIQSFDADGFTHLWVKNGSPTGSTTVMFMAFR